MQAATARCNEVQLQLKLCKKELRSVRKTVKTLELMAAAVKAGTLSATAAAASTAAAGAAPNVNVTMRATLPGQNQEAAAMQQTGAQQQQQQQQTGLLSMTTSVSIHVARCFTHFWKHNGHPGPLDSIAVAPQQ